jgi:hypothetical protein
LPAEAAERDAPAPVQDFQGSPKKVESAIALGRATLRIEFSELMSVFPLTAVAFRSRFVTGVRNKMPCMAVVSRQKKL